MGKKNKDNSSPTKLLLPVQNSLIVLTRAIIMAAEKADPLLLTPAGKPPTTAQEYTRYQENIKMTKLDKLCKLVIGLLADVKIERWNQAKQAIKLVVGTEIACRFSPEFNKDRRNIQYAIRDVVLFNAM